MCFTSMCILQFYDHYYIWKLKVEIRALLEARKRNDIKANSKCTILAAEHDFYMASIEDGQVLVKLGPRFDIGELAPSLEKYDIAAFGINYCVWERKKT